MEPHSTDTRLIRTPGYYGQFRWSRQNTHIFSLKLTRLIRTPVNMGNGHFSVSRVTNSHTSSTPLTDTGCMYLYAHCLFSLFSLSQLCAVVDIMYPVQIMTDFYGLIRIYYKKTVAKWRDMFDPSVVPLYRSFCLLRLQQSQFTFRLRFLLQSLLLASSFFLFEVLCFASASEADAD